MSGYASNQRNRLKAYLTMKNKTKSKKKKLSLLALGFKKKPVVVRNGYVNSDTIKSR